jgi:hypothetical protein
MRVGMGLIKNEHGVYHVRRKVPKALEVATARAMGVPNQRISWLKQTLATKDEKRAKVLAKPIMMEFDLCVPKTLSGLMTWWNRLSWRNDRAALFLSGRLGLTI